MYRPLTTNDIYKNLNKDFYSKKSFIGVFARDKLPEVKNYPTSFILNTQPTYKPGEHWLAVYFNKDRLCEFFDSFVFPPSIYGLDKYLKSKSSDFVSNTQQIQDNDSASCGYYTIFFILLKNRNFSLDEIISFFSKNNFKLNDYLVGHVTF